MKKEDTYTKQEMIIIFSDLLKCFKSTPMAVGQELLVNAEQSGYGQALVNAVIIIKGGKKNYKKVLANVNKIYDKEIGIYEKERKKEKRKKVIRKMSKVRK